MDLFLRRQTEAYSDPPTGDVLLCLLTAGRLRDAALDFGAGKIVGDFRPGAMFLAMNDHQHRCRARGPFELLTLALPVAHLREAFSALAPRFDDFGPLHGRAFLDAEAEGWLRSLWRLAGAQGPPDVLRTDGALSHLLARLWELGERRVDSPALRGPPSEGDIERTCVYIRSNLADPIRLEDLAAVAKCSVFQFSRRFKETLGCPPHAYLVRLRLEEACRLLALPRSRRLADIAVTCGFSDQAHFTRTFKKHLGKAPGAYRRDLGR